WTGTRYRAYPSEGGHVDFAPRNAREGSLLQWLGARYGHVSYERVCSGMAIPDLYRFMREVVGMDADPVVAARVAVSDEPTPVIVEAAFGHDVQCPTCHAALEVFVSVLAAEAGNLALKVLATGGVYLAGGMPRRVLSLLERDEFRAAFCDKGQFGALVDRIPVHVVTNPRIGLIGAIRRGVEGE
ncbi:glucokinase, partial [Candidatus Fermentibacteria bacterium]|nr:glucokinase [Candidatus Fermentibacteria bacterium]